MNNIIDNYELYMKMKADYIPKYDGPFLYHYTSSQALISILLGNQDKPVMWASRYDCLNDASEGKVAEMIFKEVCLELRDRGEISDYLYNLFSSAHQADTIVLNILEGDTIKITSAEFDRYVCSLSTNNDSLAMWNYYSKGNIYEGFNIGFFSNQMKESLDVFLSDKESSFHIYPVIYDKNKQKELIEELLLDLKREYDKKREKSIKNIISTRLLDWSLVFKHECFKHEEEVRIIVDVAKKEKNIPVKYRMNSGYVIPYIELELEKCDVSDVYFGPLQCNEEQKKQQVKIMNEMLKNNGYCTVVDHSKIPVRY